MATLWPLLFICSILSCLAADFRHPARIVRHLLLCRREPSQPTTPPTMANGQRADTAVPNAAMPILLPMSAPAIAPTPAPAACLAVPLRVSALSASGPARSAPTEQMPSPFTRSKTPAGTPTSCSISANTVALKGGHVRNAVRKRHRQADLPKLRHSDLLQEAEFAARRKRVRADRMIPACPTANHGPLPIWVNRISPNHGIRHVADYRYQSVYALDLGTSLLDLLGRVDITRGMLG